MSMADGLIGAVIGGVLTYVFSNKVRENVKEIEHSVKVIKHDKAMIEEVAREIAERKHLEGNLHTWIYRNPFDQPSEKEDEDGRLKDLDKALKAEEIRMLFNA